MTQPTNKTRGQFQSLKANVFNSMIELWDRENEAIAAGNTALADQLFNARIDLREDLMEIRKAEIAFLTSAKTLKQQITNLSGAIKTVKSGVARMKSLNTSLKGAAQVASILTSLVGLLA